MALKPPRQPYHQHFVTALQGAHSLSAPRRRLQVLMWGVGGVLLLLLSRLYTLQIVRGEAFMSKGRRNFVQKVQIAHDRGIIYDRYGRILVDNRPSLNLQVTPAFLGKPAVAQRTLEHVAELLDMSASDCAHIQATVANRRGLERFRPLLVQRDLQAEQVEAIEAERSLFRLDGVDIVEGRRRTYHFNTTAAHVLGYVGEIDALALEQERSRGNPEHYELGDIMGREGLERTFESTLRGEDGVEKIIVDAKGRRQQQVYVDTWLRDKQRHAPRPGHNVYLTLDFALQERAEAIFLQYGQAGSVVALEPQSGAILVLASLPAYNPNWVSGAFSALVKKSLDDDPLKPWMNRAIAGQYAPGSTFKPVTALAALQQNSAHAHERVACPGYYRLGRHVWRCWRDQGHGAVDLHTAMKVSCDAFFYNMGGRTGINAIANIARLLGFGRRTQIGLRGEQAGLVPDEAFHQRVDAPSGGYQRGMAINTAIGQGALLVTPLQMAVAYAAMAHGSTVFVPQLVERIETADFRVTQRALRTASPAAAAFMDAAAGVQTNIYGVGPRRLAEFAPRPASQLQLDAVAMQQVRASLAAVTSEPGGTGYRRRSLKTSMAGKTGTAQVVRLGRERHKAAAYDERDHAWFVAYAPSEAPQIAVAVLNEHAGHGGSAAEPIAVAVIDAFFALQAERQAAGEASPPSQVSTTSTPNTAALLTQVP